MTRSGLAVVFAVVLCASSRADTYVVRNKNDSGTNSLRWAIYEANAHAGPDSIVFSPDMTGKVIELLSELPIITDNGTSINGDIDADGFPDVHLQGGSFNGSGLIVWGDQCTIRGLGVMQFTGAGIGFAGCKDSVVKACQIGFRTGHYAPNGTGIYLSQTTGCRIGGLALGERNYIHAGTTSSEPGIVIEDGQDNHIVHNYLGVKTDGISPIGYQMGPAILVKDTAAAPDTRWNVIGSTSGGNVITNCTDGIVLDGACDSRVIGNFIGFGADGVTPLEYDHMYGVVLMNGAKRNRIGGTTASAANLFALGTGVSCQDPGTSANRIQGNYFGLNAVGEEAGPIYEGVLVEGDAGSQTIGGATLGAGNYFAADGRAIKLDRCGTGTVIRFNRIGLRSNGRNMSGKMTCGLLASVKPPAKLVLDFHDNIVACCKYGIRVEGSGTRVYAYRNRFRSCTRAIQADHQARLFLGDLGNAGTDDDGGNVFLPSNLWFIRNHTGRFVKAEGNDFSTTDLPTIDSKIWDQIDRPYLGLVDIDPLAGGIHPSGEYQEAALTIMGATAAPCAAGAEITFTLSAEAGVTVEVLNIAGCCVAVLTPGGPKTLEPGLQRLLWNGRTSLGPLAPAGQYLVRITARKATGQMATALCTIGLRR